MAVTRVSSAIADSDTLTMPSHQQHDLLIAIIFRTTGTGETTVPSGWRLRVNRSTYGSFRVYDKVAASGSESFGTWTNATQVAVIVYRSNADKLLTTINGAVASGASSAIINYSAVGNLGLMLTNSFIVGCAGVMLNNTDAEVAPVGMTNIASVAGGSAGELVVHDTNGEVASWSSTNVDISPSSNYQAITFGIQETAHPVPTGGGGGIGKLLGNGLIG